MTINTGMAALVGFGCEAFFYGCYTILFALSIYLMFHGPRRGIGYNKPIITLSGLLYLSCSAHFAIEFSHFYQALTATGVHGFATGSNALVGASFLTILTNFIAELILIYRCWLLWSRNYWVVIFPTLFSVASLVFYGVYTYFVLHINPKSPVVPPSVGPLALSTFFLPLGTNVIVTTLICARIWYLSPRKARNMPRAQFSTGTSQTIIKIVVESGMLYLAVQLVLAVLIAIKHRAKIIVGVIAVQIYGIAPTLILIRVGLGVANMQNEPIRSGPPPSMSQPTSSTQVRINKISFTEPASGLHVPAEMSVSGMKSKPSNGDLGSVHSSMEKVAAVEV